jgi:hypothetical protein
MATSLFMIILVNASYSYKSIYSYSIDVIYSVTVNIIITVTGIQ